MTPRVQLFPFTYSPLSYLGFKSTRNSTSTPQAASWRLNSLAGRLLSKSLAPVLAVGKLSLGHTIFLGTSGMYMKWRNGAVHF